MSSSKQNSAALGVGVDVPVAALGPAASKRVLEQCSNLLTGIAITHQGQVLDGGGGNLSITFSNAADAMRAAREMCRQIAGLPPAAGTRITVSIGAALSLGKAMALLLNASPGQILTDPELDAILQPATQVPASLPEGDTLPAPKPAPRPARPNPEAVGKTRMVLRHQDKTVVVDEENREAKIGRGPDCVLQINDAWASRIHATILKQGGRFVIIDSSTNGTFLKQGDQPEVHLNRRSLTLDADGSFGLGRTGEQALGGPVIYTLE